MFDFAIVAIVASNVAAAWVASTHGWSLQLLLWTYWVQSTLIGVFSFRRILALRRFGTDGVTWNDKPIEPTNETKHRFAWFFAAHFGIFHVVHFVFLAVLGVGGKLGAPLLSTDIEWILLLGFAFALSHGLSQRVNLAADLRHEQNIGALMILPYARVIPMHLTVLLAFHLKDVSSTLLLFVILKTFADVAMHVFEHYWLQTGRLRTFRLNIGTEGD